MSLADRLSAQALRPFPPHLIIEALAGTGKTTTLIEGLKIVKGLPVSITPSPQQEAVWESLARSTDAQSVGFVAFNAAIAKELQNRVPAGVDARTMHSLGLKGITAAFGKLDINEYRVQDMIAAILGKDIRDIRRVDFELIRGTERLVQLVKMNLTDTDPDSLDELSGHYDVELNGSRGRVYDLVPQIIERCKDVNADRKIDYNDMVWLPNALDIRIPQFDLLLVDESQDLNRCQQALAKKSGKRLVLCGDKHQAIYGFAGADAESMDRMFDELAATPFGCDRLPLTVTRRCGRAIVAEAQELVPEFEAHESNGEGLIRHLSFVDPKNATQADQVADDVEETHYVSIVEPGDLLICRVNAPIVRECFRFLKLGKKAHIQGRDIGQGLISTIRKVMKGADPFDANDARELVSRLSDWHHAEEAKELAKRNPNESRLILLSDRHDCLAMFCEGLTEVNAVIARIESIFTDQRDTPGIKLSTIHKAKGLEARRVFLIEPFGSGVPHPMAKSAWQIDQEYNLRYVAITRAIEELVYVR